MKKYILRGILIILLLGTFLMIFGFSSQNGEKSGNLSKRVTYNIMKNNKKIQDLEEIGKEKYLYHIEMVIRKLAHFSIYTIVGALLMGIMCTYKINDVKKIINSLIIGIIYASSDEMHQYFIPERAARLTDVMIDTIGVMLGITIILLAMKIYRKCHNEK